MRSSVAPPRPEPLPVATQAWVLRSRYPAAQHPVVDGSSLTWSVQLQPTPLSVTYTVRLQYRLGHPPVANVIDPPMQRVDDQHLPHVFDGDVLCLYYDEFDDTRDLIGVVLIPWVAEWLYHYEAWLLTEGDWHGGGFHAEDAPPLNRAARRRALRAAAG